MIVLRPSRAEDFRDIELGYYDRLSVGNDLVAAGEVWRGKAISAVEDGRVLGIAGLAVDGDEGTVTMVLSDALRARPHALHRLVRRKLGEMMVENGLKRLHAAVHHEFKAGHRWLERLGFKCSHSDGDWWRYTL